MKQNNADNHKSKMTTKQIGAIIGIVLLIAMYVITLIAAIADPSASGRWFQACLVATFTIPLLIWVYIWMYGKLTNKHTMADFDRNESDSASRK